MKSTTFPLSPQDVEDESLRTRGHPLYEWPPTDKLTVLMQAVLANSLESVARLLRDPGHIWNQRGPCGRKPEQAALELGHFEAHAMLLAHRERAELTASVSAESSKAPKRL